MLDLCFMLGINKSSTENDAKFCPSHHKPDKLAVFSVLFYH